MKLQLHKITGGHLFSTSAKGNTKEFVTFTNITSKGMISLYIKKLALAGPKLPNN